MQPDQAQQYVLKLHQSGSLSYKGVFLGGEIQAAKEDITNAYTPPAWGFCAPSMISGMK